MDLNKAGLVICLTVTIVIFVNVMIYFALRGKNTTRQMDLFRLAADRARRPWEKENADLEELSKLVDGLQSLDKPSKKETK